MDELILRAALATLALGLIAGPVGCFIVWRKMAFFGHAVSHAAVLGIAMGLALGIDLMLGVIVTGMAIALLLVGLEARRILAADTLIGILGHGTLAAGIVALSFMPRVRMDLMGYLFGDVLAVMWGDVMLTWVLAISVLALMTLLWRPLLSLTVHEDLARVEGVPTLRVRILYMLIVAAVIAAGMQVVGILLIISLLIIPAAAARPLSTGPAQMAAIATLFAILSQSAGLAAAFAFDAPAGPSIVLASVGLFTISFLGSALIRR